LRKTLRRIVIRPPHPGALYNFGNALGFAVGLALALGAASSSDEHLTLWERALTHLVGSPSALALTIATIIFFWGGMVYGKAWSAGALTDPRLNRWGDMLSGIGAIVLGAGLTMLGDPWLAASAGAMHALGKFGSALGSEATAHLPAISERSEALFKDLVLVSRVPAILASATALWQELASPQGVQGLLLALSFMTCSIIWAAADWMLLSPRGWIRTTAASFLTPKA